MTAPDAAAARQVQFAIDDGPAGAAIADGLLADRLVSCVQQLGPVTSRYRWQGVVEQSEEWLFLAKTTSDRVDDVIARIAAAHPYDTPEIIVTEVVGGLDRYLEWNAASTTPEAG